MMSSSGCCFSLSLPVASIPVSSRAFREQRSEEDRVVVVDVSIRGLQVNENDAPLFRTTPALKAISRASRPRKCNHVDKETCGDE